MYAQKIFPSFLTIWLTLRGFWKNSYSASCSQLDKGTPLSARRLRREPLLKRVASCVHIVRPCLVFSLSFPGFPLSLSFLCFSSPLSFPCLFFFLSCSDSFFSLSLSCSGLTRTSKLSRHAERVTRTSNRKRHAECVTRTSPLQIPRSNRGMTRESKSQQ